MAKVTFNGVTLAESDKTVVVENNHYFPAESLNMDYFQDSERDLMTVCPWKGNASYYDIVVDDEKLRDAAWYYAEPKKAAEKIKGHVAFYKTRVDIVVDKDAEEVPITLKVTNQHWLTALELVSERGECILERRSPTLIYVSRPERVTFSFKNEDIKNVINVIATYSGANIVLSAAHACISNSARWERLLFP